MTHHVQITALDDVGRLPADHGFDGQTDAFRVLLNEVMRLERAAPTAGSSLPWMPG